MKDNFSDVEQRVKRYWYVDGFGELVGGGGMCLILAVYFATQQYFGDDSLVGSLLQVGLFFVLVGGMFLVGRLINGVRVGGGKFAGRRDGPIAAEKDHRRYIPGEGRRG